MVEREWSFFFVLNFDQRIRRRPNIISKTEQDTDAHSPTSQASITHLTHSTHLSPPHIAVVTDADKSIHFLQLQGRSLSQIRHHVMPKRPCAITFTPDDRYVLSGDKFGDVYALPLDPGEASEAANGGVLGKRKRGVFKPAATDLTVHMGRNRKALENQVKGAERLAQLGEQSKGQRLEKENGQDGDGGQKRDAAISDTQGCTALRPILGHVSMLLDLIAVSKPAPASALPDQPQSKKYRNYIITCDRDEHVRVSRGIPQAHVIETFCLGHTSFVNKLCIVEQDILVSGGGDGFLCMWDWVRGKLVGKVDLEGPAQGARSISPFNRSEIAVRGLWMLESENGQVSHNNHFQQEAHVEKSPFMARHSSPQEAFTMSK